MKKLLLLCLVFFSFWENTVAQEGIFAIARYDTSGPMKLRSDDPLLEFTGGFEAFQNLFLKEFKMPTKALRIEKAPDGMVGFTVNLVGKIVDIEVIDSCHYEIDDEIVRVLTNISDFHPQVKPQKFVIQYNVYPYWFRQYIKDKEQAESDRRQAIRTDSLLKSTKIEDLKKLVDNKRVYVSADIWIGFTKFGDPLSKFLKPTRVFGADLNFHKNNWFAGGNMQLRNTHLKQEFEHIDAYWANDTSVSLLSMGITGGYKVIDEDRLAFTPFVSIGFGSLALPSEEDYTPPNGSSIVSFAPTLGFFVDYKYKVRARRSFFESKLNTSTIRIRLGISPMNFREKRRGTVVDLGIGLAFWQQNLKIN